jgi:UDP-N-acetyl-D-mannosaminuronic acid dehydrogenase
MREIKTACVVGAGYVGLPTAALLARSGIQVTLVDIDVAIVEAINARTHEVEEDSINRLLDDPIVVQNLTSSLTPAASDAFFVCVPTPIEHESKRADLSFVVAACESIVPVLSSASIVIVESTIPALCTRNTVMPILERTGLKAGIDFHVAHCPERVMPGNALAEIVGNSRVIGGVTPACALAAADVYRYFAHGELHLASDIEAEICKLSENAFRDVNIAFANELAAVCAGLGIDSMRVINLANQHPRVQILAPGIGVGGHCIPVDPWFIAETDPNNSTLIQCARKINDGKPERIAAAIRAAVEHIGSPRIVCSGTAFKPNCKDERESPALAVIRFLQDAGLEVVAVDPVVDGARYETLEIAAAGADLIAVLVEHSATNDELRDRQKVIEDAMREPTIMRFFQPADIETVPARAAVLLDGVRTLEAAA